MLPVLFMLLLCVQPCQAQQVDTLASDMADTLRTVVVTGRSRPAVVDAIDRSMKAHPQPRVKTLGEVLNERFPNLMDCILHPFAIKARKRERRQKRLQRILREYELTKTPNELLLEAIRNEQLRDSMRATTHQEE